MSLNLKIFLTISLNLSGDLEFPGFLNVSLVSLMSLIPLDVTISPILLITCLPSFLVSLIFIRSLPVSHFLHITDSLTHWLNDRLTDWLTDWFTDWLTDWLSDWLNDSLTNSLTFSRPHARTHSFCLAPPRLASPRVGAPTDIPSFLSWILRPCRSGAPSRPLL